jgi:hypothetical protein
MCVRSLDGIIHCSWSTCICSNSELRKDHWLFQLLCNAGSSKESLPVPEKEDCLRTWIKIIMLALTTLWGQGCEWLLCVSYASYVVRGGVVHGCFILLISRARREGGKCLEVFAFCYDNVVLALNSLQTHTRYEHQGLMYWVHFDESWLSVQPKGYDAIQVQDCNGPWVNPD